MSRGIDINYLEKLRGIRSRGERVLVVGLGISGIESGLYLRRSGIDCICVERQSEAEYLNSAKFGAEFDKLRKSGAICEFGIEGESVSRFLDRVGLCVLSPGVSLESAICGALRRRKIEMISELELGIELLRRRAIVVTGSNGKSTTVSLIHEMLKAGGLDSTLCGNVGVPVIAQVPGDLLDGESAQSEAWLVVEASSYQLESCTVLKPKIGALLNISDNHLERHGTLERYLEIKAKLFENQDGGDYALLDGDDARVATRGKKLKAKVALFGEESSSSANTDHARVADLPSGGRGVIVQLQGRQEIYSVSASRLRGRHNLKNVAVSALAARLAGAAQDTIQRAIDHFIPLEHRWEAVLEKNGVLYINDSKSTTVAASLAALNATLESYPGRRIVLLIGGLSKVGSWDPLLSAVKAAGSAIQSIICFGKDGALIGSHCKKHGLSFKCESNLQRATSCAATMAGEGQIVLLTPGCASFDEFSDFEERGNVFKSLVANL